MRVSVDDYLTDLRHAWDWLQQSAGFWRPVLPLPTVLQPVATLGTLLALVATTGLALTSLALLVTSALLVYLLLTEVFGFEIAVALPY